MSTPNESDTPRTDAQHNHVYQTYGDYEYAKYAGMTNFARKLERELNEAKQELSSQNKLLAELAAWKEGCERNAQCWKDSARQCDEQRLTIIELRAQIAELKEDQEHLEELTKLLNARFPRRADGSLPDFSVEDVLKENTELRKDKERCCWIGWKMND